MAEKKKEDKAKSVDEPVVEDQTVEEVVVDHTHDGQVPPPDDPMDPPAPGLTDDAQKDNRDGN